MSEVGKDATNHCLRTIKDFKTISVVCDYETFEVFVRINRLDFLYSADNDVFLATFPLPLSPPSAKERKLYNQIGEGYPDWVPWNIWLGSVLSYTRQKFYLNLLPCEMAELVELVHLAMYTPHAVFKWAAYQTITHVEQCEKTAGYFNEKVVEPTKSDFYQMDFGAIKRHIAQTWGEQWCDDTTSSRPTADLDIEDA
jgi:hypothetical protein